MGHFGDVPTLQSWHRHLGHANYRTVYDLMRSGNATGMPVNLSVVPPKCDACILGKQMRTSVPKVRTGSRVSRKLGIVHVDLMEHPDTVSATGHKYVMNIIDNFSSYAWAIPLATKSDAFPALQAWERTRELESNSKVGIYRSDNGELKTAQMRDWLLSCSTQHQFTAPHMSAQNGHVERLHRTLMGKARAMRTACNVPANRWDEFVLTACYLSNRTPVTSQDGHTPFECWTDQKLDLSHLHETGCRAFVLIQNQHNPKVYSRSIKCVLIGYSLDSKAYRCYHRQTHKVFVSYHVSFIESHQSGPEAPLPSASTASTRPVTVEEVPDVNTPQSSTPTPTPLAPVQPRRSECIPQPSECHCTLENKPYVSPMQRTILNSLTVADRIRALSSTNGKTPPSENDAHAALQSGEESTHLANLFAAMPIHLEHEFADDPTTYAEAMASEHAPQWTAALKEEFDSLRDLGVYKLVPRSSIPPGRKIMRGRPIFKLKRDQHSKPVHFKARYIC